MKIHEIILKESVRDYDLDQEVVGLDDEFGDDFEDDLEQEMELSSSADRKVVNAVLSVCDKLKGEGNSRIDLLPFITQVSEKAGKMVNLADLIAVNKQSPEIQSIIDSIDEKSVKFKNTSVKNTDPSKGKAGAADQGEATLRSMASRAANRR